MGMSYREFWLEDVSLVLAYREADMIRRRRKNEEMWMQALYIYKAVGSLHPLFNSLKPQDAQPFMQEPIDFWPEEVEDNQETEDQRINRGLDYFMALMATANKNFKKGADKVGHDNRQA